VIAGFYEQANALAEGEVDVPWIETMSSNEEIAVAIEAAKATGLPICATMTFDTASRSMMGVMPAEFAEFVRGLGANFIGANCGIGPAELLHSVRGILAASGSLPVVAKENCGIPAYVDGAIHYHGTPEFIAEYALFARDAGAKIMGGVVVLARHMWRQWLPRLIKPHPAISMRWQWLLRLGKPGRMVTLKTVVRMTVASGVVAAAKREYRL